MHRFFVQLCSMKWVYYVMTFLVLSLSCTPCSAGEREDVAQNASSKTRQESKQDDDKHVHNPFCVCACANCVGFCSPQFTYFEFSQPTFIVSVSCSSYSESFVSELAYQIWQPPKI